MSKDRNIDRFDPAKISLELWLSLFEAHCMYLGIASDSTENVTKKKHLLLVSLGSEVYAVLGRICAPDLPHIKSYDELIAALKQHYIVSPSYHRSLVAFQQRKKVPGETLHNLYADLKALAKDCQFSGQFDARVRDQLFMAVDGEVYFPNLVAENFKLQTLSSQDTFDRILNMERAFGSDKSTGNIKAVSVSQNLQKSKQFSNKPKFSCNKPSVANNGNKPSCKHCGYPHPSEKCKFKNWFCKRCGRQGHLKAVCSYDSGTFHKKKDKKFGKKKYGASAANHVDESSSSDSEATESNLYGVKPEVFSVKSELINFSLNEQIVPFEVDTGAWVSTLTEDWVRSLLLVMKPYDKTLRAYGHTSIKVLGKVDVTVSYNNKVVTHTFCVVQAGNSNLCGNDLQKKVGIGLTGIDEKSRVTKVNQIDASSVLNDYKVDSSKPITSFTASIHLKPEATPKFYRSRTVPFHYRPMVEDALDALVEDGVISPVKYSEWAAPIVPVLKPDKKSMRICADFKYVNKFLEVDQYPLPKVDELLSVIGKGQFFSKVDLKDAYLQIPVDEEAQKVLVINTPKGLFRYNRLPFGLASSPAIFQRYMAQLMSDIPGVAVFLDDILVSGPTEKEHDERMMKVLNVLKENNLKINKSKSEFKVSSIEYLGYQISGQGVKPSDKKIKAILEAPAPVSVAEVKSFVGLVTYYCRFVPNFSTILAPLYDLLQKNANFKWTKIEQNAFVTIKEQLSNSMMLANFDGYSPLILEVDASPIGVGCVLKQLVNGVEQPVYFASKKLSPAEKNYSQLDKEALALVYGVKKLEYFLLGRHFVAKTDHKPLLGLFGKEKSIPINANARVQRWALLLSQNNFDLMFQAGKDNQVADALSRLPVADPNNNSKIPAEYINLVNVLECSDVNLDKVKLHTKKDPVLKCVVNNLKFGWENTPIVSEFSLVKSDLSLHDELVLFRNRIVIPSDLRKTFLEFLHQNHNGVNAMRVEARNWVWWPKLDQDLVEVTKACSVCFANHKPPQSQSLSWPDSGKPWSRLHIDYAGPVDGLYFLIIVDSFSKFMDVHSTRSITSNFTIKMLRKTFANFGLPDTVVSDNAPNFCSKEMSEFFEKNGVKHVTPAPYNPASNGLAERAVRTFKEGLHKFKEGEIDCRVNRFLYNQRRTVCASTGKSPSELLMGRCFKGPFNSLKEKKKKRRNLEDAIQVLPKFNLDDAVFAKNYGKGDLWVPGKIVEVLGVRNYKVQLKNYGNVLWKRHADQIMPRFLSEQPNTDQKPLPHFVLNNQSVLNNNNNVEINDQNVNQETIVNSGAHISNEPVKKAPISVKTNELPMSPKSASEKRTSSGRVVKPPMRLTL